MKLIFFILSFSIFNILAAQSVGVVYGVNSAIYNYISSNANTLAYKSSLGYQMGIDLRIKLKNDALVFYFREHEFNQTIVPTFWHAGVKYRFENKQLLSSNIIITDILDIGISLNKMKIFYPNTKFRYKRTLPTLSICYGILNNSKSFGIQYGILFWTPRKFTYQGFEYSTPIFSHQLSLLIYPVIKFKKKNKPVEIRRRNR